ncbi:MAG: hypothetical protein IH849_04115, partial [Acidobacteria bacterium]|nr:hypothetical protein [Acidobacteriota bacterium]
MTDRNPTPRVERIEPGLEVRAQMRRFYREAADYGAQVAAHDESYFRKYVRSMLRFVPPGVGDLLELGAGSGAALTAFVRQRSPARVVGLELSSSNLAAIGARGSPYEAVGGDA